MKTFSIVLFALFLGAVAAVHAETLDANEVDDLRFMVEEEKLAHDVYLAFQRRYQERVFPNIRRSEARHIDAMAGLLDRYGIEDPSKPQAGEFDSAYLQSLYDELIARGSASRVEAIKVGALIEETDMRDIVEAMERTDEWAIQRVYANLLDGSKSHLRAFVGRLRQLGVEYQPVILGVEEYSAIIAAQ